MKQTVQYCMKSIIVLAFEVLNTSVTLAVEAPKNEHKNKPNVIVVITDDQGWGVLGCRGNPFIKTPNLDKLHGEAVRFTNFHVSTTCAPSRSSLMTGRHCNRLNVFHTIMGRSLLFEDELLLPEVLADNGYVNGMFGKWHLGDNYPFRPEDRGFHEVVRHGAGGITQGPDYWRNDYFDDTYWHNGKTEAYTGYCTDVFFEEAMRFMETNRKKPFFLYLATNAPHAPYNVPERYYNLYKDVPELSDRFKRFYGMITNIDDNMKRLEDKLEALGLDFQPAKPLDGISFKSLLQDEDADWPNRMLYMDTQRLQNVVKYRTYTVMDKAWRLVNGSELYNMTDDLGQTQNVLDQHPEVAERLTKGYEHWWQSIMDDDVNERYAYIKVGTPHEHPSCISSHDMLTGKHLHAWHQYGAVNASQTTGRWKIEFAESGKYSISLRRFPRESGLSINATFPADEERLELDRTFPGSTKDDFASAYLYMANLGGTQEITGDQSEVTFTGDIPAGKCDMEAHLIDRDKRVYPAYYVYIEKL